MNFVKLLNAIGITIMLANMMFLLVTLLILCARVLFFP